MTAVDKMGAGGYSSVMKSEKYAEIINKQKQMDKEIIERTRRSLANKGVVLYQSVDIDRMLMSRGAEALTFSDGTIVMHTKVSASGFYEELIHYGQIKANRTIEDDKRNNLLLEIEAKERLIKYRQAYQITDYEVEILTEVLKKYKIDLEALG